MKLSEAIVKGRAKYWIGAHIRKNPGEPRNWFVMLLNRNAKQFMLVDENEAPIINDDFNELVTLLKQVGVSEFTTFL